ncbi:MAG TPA: type II toxin-antitoxin system Phd/YefM family antitoxin [Caldilineaceae bacterium]|nr:type II toxin-antitoxin system Phd/YefM family antitoxin [Caldilineaceae bacterium]
MSVSVSSNEARSSLGRLLRLAAEKDEKVVIEVRGQPKAVLVSYADYQELLRWKKSQQAVSALEKIRAARESVLARTEELSERDAYRLAGFGERAADEIVSHDRQIGGDKQ